MSLQGLVTIRGSKATVRRGVRTQQANLSFSTVYSTVATVDMDLSVLTRKAAEMTWGLETKATVKGTCALGSNVQEDDGLQITAGLFAGKQLRVVGVREFKTSFGSDHMELGLELATTETFA